MADKAKIPKLYTQLDADGNQIPSKSAVWKMFRKIDLTPFHEEKNNLTYVSWSRAWSTAMDLIGDHLQIKWHGMTNAEGVILDYIEAPGSTASVCCSAMMNGVKYAECTLAVMNYRNDAIENPTSVDLQNSRQRCQTKLLAMMGLGLYLWENDGEFEGTGGPVQAPPKKKATSEKKTTTKKPNITSEKAIKELKSIVNDLWTRGWKPEAAFEKEIKSAVGNVAVIAPEEIQKLIESVKKVGEIALQIHDDKKEENSDA
jgi:hypothetical protein